MSVRARIEDALIGKGYGRHEGALLSTLVAIAATSRKRYPRHNVTGDLKRDRVAFTRFLDDECESLWGSERFLEIHMPMIDPGHEEPSIERRPFAEIAYRVLRNPLVHSGTLGTTARFDAHDTGGLRLEWDSGANAFTFNAACLDALISLVVVASENASVFSDWLESGVMSVPVDVSILVGIQINAAISTQVADRQGAMGQFTQRISYNLRLSEQARSRCRRSSGK